MYTGDVRKYAEVHLVPLLSSMTFLQQLLVSATLLVVTGRLPVLAQGADAKLWGEIGVRTGINFSDAGTASATLAPGVLVGVSALVYAGRTFGLRTDLAYEAVRNGHVDGGTFRADLLTVSLLGEKLVGSRWRVAGGAQLGRVRQAKWEGEQTTWIVYPVGPNTWLPRPETVQQDLMSAFEASGKRTYWSLVGQLAMRPRPRLEIAFRAEALVQRWQALVTDDVSPYVLNYTRGNPPQVSHGGRRLALGLTANYWLGPQTK